MQTDKQSQAPAALNRTDIGAWQGSPANNRNQERKPMNPKFQSALRLMEKRNS